MVIDRRQFGIALVALVLLAPGAIPSTPHPDRDAIREKVDEIVSRQEFQGVEDTSTGWLLRILFAVLQWMASLYGKSPFLFWLLLSGCALAVGLLVAWIVLRVRRSMALWSGSRRRQAEQQQRELAHDYEKEALQFAAGGEFTEAIRSLFLALVHRLDETGRALFRRSWTNREYLKLFDDRPAVAANLRVFVDALDDHWYGQRPADEGEYRRCRSVFETVAG